MGRGIVFAVALCALLSVVSSGTVLAAPAYKLELVQLVHRHGARSALVSYNETKICGTEFPCGYLNYQGQLMLLNFGKFLRHRYTEDASVVSEPYFPYDSYNLSISYTRSTDVLRTLQSANALLRGLFPDSSAYFPAVHTVENHEDVLLHSSMVPLIRARYNYAQQEVRDVCDPVLDKRMSFETLQATAAEVHSQDFCSNYTLRSACAETLCDIAHAYESTGQLDSTPLLRQHLDDVCAVTATSSYFYFSYNKSDPVHQKQGGPYYHLTKTLVRNMHLHLHHKTAPPFKLYEYSAHDSTISPLATSLGDNSLEAMLPPFGTAFIVELLSAAEGSASSKSWYVRVLRGHPGVTPSTNFTFALNHFPMRCMNAENNTYVADDNVCPLADFERFVASTAPTSEMGTCYLDPILNGRMDCPVDAVGDNRTLSSDCLVYRKLCPKYACGTGYYLDAVDYGCRRIKATEEVTESTGMSRGGIAALSIALFIAGTVAGVAGMVLKKRFIKPKNGEQTQAFIE
ncbi:membrane-bound acid phosphatase precursor [Leptomonas pyrrhocoris]|uniref:Membrane-bound acid phosphatase n=1 Tax=Leptomonas pyrrhocoris TaxID=157538 RepID=A0A0N0DW24_LEPPY|nr:membrane-bound acid phosphatase precursor [Leptomonas pyrrhocoris]XP_015659650.1 membrane-bound acid phosphatase precursor [Leptomonas pyrrhocoris]KPA81210.1 membrane-bound acid phosphatase precursor [Leptomonas pyrrhocoris]KPA81211.1 membrane-bound acid phosphatase precursor [Leptomonas pyrrhocoris]|eukprot:XP_015659649.1 membrane-bound acid phosphatase precursor [Leptomonas pyrrhocoris]